MNSNRNHFFGCVLNRAICVIAATLWVVTIRSQKTNLECDLALLELHVYFLYFMIEYPITEGHQNKKNKKRPVDPFMDGIF